MDTPQINRAAALLVEARRNRTLLDGLPADATPASVADAHAIQDAVTAGLGKPVGAYKAMAPANGEPTRGVIYADTIHRLAGADSGGRGAAMRRGRRGRVHVPPRPAAAGGTLFARRGGRSGGCVRCDRAGHQPLSQFRCGIEFAEAGRQHQQRRLRACRAVGRLAQSGTRQAEGDADGERHAGARAGGRASDRRSARHCGGAGEHDARARAACVPGSS